MRLIKCGQRKKLGWGGVRDPKSNVSRFHISRGWHLYTRNLIILVIVKLFRVEYLHLIISTKCVLTGILTCSSTTTNAVSECSFSALKRVKTYLRSTTGEGRFNHLMLLHVHKELADGIDMVEVANLFVGDNQRRKHLFWEVFKKRPAHEVYVCL